MGGVGAPITTGALATDLGPAPAALRATTRKVYVFPLVRPEIVCAVAALLNTVARPATAPRKGVTA
jgi:hypothetical protein